VQELAKDGSFDASGRSATASFARALIAELLAAELKRVAQPLCIAAAVAPETLSGAACR